MQKAYAKNKGVSLKCLMKEIFFNKVDDEFDFLLADSSLKEYEQNPKTYALKEVEEELGIN